METPTRHVSPYFDDSEYKEFLTYLIDNNANEFDWLYINTEFKKINGRTKRRLVYVTQPKN